jgi:hypothetical protein
MTTSLAAGKTASIAIRRKTAYAPCDAMCDSHVEVRLASTERVYERDALTGERSVAFPVELVATTRTW